MLRIILILSALYSVVVILASNTSNECITNEESVYTACLQGIFSDCTFLGNSYEIAGECSIGENGASACGDYVIKSRTVTNRVCSPPENE